MIIHYMAQLKNITIVDDTNIVHTMLKTYDSAHHKLEAMCYCGASLE